MLKENTKSVTRVFFAMLYEFYCIVLKISCASISIDASSPEQKSKYVNKTSRVHVESLFNQHDTESMIIYTVYLYF